MNKLHEVVIIGGGFAGLNAAKALASAPVKVTLIDRRNHHLFQPLLYQVATGGLSPADISAPIRALLQKQANAHVRLGNVTDIDVVGRKVLLEDGEVSYDTLIVATGANHAYFGNDHWAQDAPGLKTLGDATHIRHKILMAFEKAEQCEDPVEREAWLTFVIAGAGPTGVELAGALAELANHTLTRDFRNIKPSDAVIHLVDGSDRVLRTFGEGSSDNATRALKRLGVNIKTNAMVTDIDQYGVTLKCNDQTSRIASRTVLWAAGVRASLLGRALGKATGVETDRVGRVKVDKQFAIPGFSEIRVVGDLALAFDSKGKPLPGTAAVAQQEGNWVGRHVKAMLGGKKCGPFEYFHYGDLAVIGRSAAVAEMGRMKLRGNPAWWFWLLVHLMKLVDLQNRLLVLIQWSWSYFTRKRSARLINGEVSHFGSGVTGLDNLETESETNGDVREAPGTEKKKKRFRLIA